MNIGIVTTWLERGAAHVSRAYMEALSRRHQVFIYARGGEHYAQGDPGWDGDYVTWGKRVPGKTATYVEWGDFKEWVRSNGLDTVIFNEQQHWDIILRAQRLDVAIGAYVDYYTPETVPFFHLYDFLLCNTRRHYSVFEDHPQALYIPWGTDLDVFKPTDRTGSTGSVTFFHSSGLSPLRKGTDILVKAFRQVKGDAQLVIHSQCGLHELGYFNDLLPEQGKRIMQNMATSIVEDARITLWQAEVGPPGLYHLGDVYVYPTRLEGIGLTIAEALACGLPVITTNAAPMNEFVVHDLNGKLVDVQYLEPRSDNYYWPQNICSQAALSGAMQFFVDNPEVLAEYRGSARRYAESNLDWEHNSARLHEFLSSAKRLGQRADRCLVESVAAYAKSQRPPTSASQYVRHFLIACGARRLRRVLVGWTTKSRS